LPELKPKYGENNYFSQFNDINNDIELWVVRQANINPLVTLSEETKYTLVSAIKELDERAGNILEAQKMELLSDYKNRRKYIALVRHIVAVFLHSQIFGSFVFGLNRKEADDLNGLEGEICNHGLFRL